MKIGEIAQQARVSKSIIRYYEGKGVLPRASRNSSGYRDYGAKDLQRIRLVAGARRLGCSFDEIRNIIAMQEQASLLSLDMLELLAKKVDEVACEIDQLRFLRTELARLHEMAMKLAEEGLAADEPCLQETRPHRVPGRG